MLFLVLFLMLHPASTISNQPTNGGQSSTKSQGKLELVADGGTRATG